MAIQGVNCGTDWGRARGVTAQGSVRGLDRSGGGGRRTARHPSGGQGASAGLGLSELPPIPLLPPANQDQADTHHPQAELLLLKACARTFLFQTPNTLGRCVRRPQLPRVGDWEAEGSGRPVACLDLHSPGGEGAAGSLFTSPRLSLLAGKSPPSLPRDSIV